MKGRTKLINDIWYVFYVLREPEQPTYFKEYKLLNQNQEGLEDGKDVEFKIIYEQSYYLTEARAILI